MNVVSICKLKLSLNHNVKKTFISYEHEFSFYNCVGVILFSIITWILMFALFYLILSYLWSLHINYNDTVFIYYDLVIFTLMLGHTMSFYYTVMHSCKRGCVYLLNTCSYLTRHYCTFNVLQQVTFLSLIVNASYQTIRL